MSHDAGVAGVDGASGLLVYVPGLSARDRSGELLLRLAADLGPGWQLRVWHHRLTPVSSERLEDVAHRLAVQVRTWAGDNGTGPPVENVVLVGHSIGGLLVRHAFLLDAGFAGGSPPPFPWTSRVRRLALLAAPNAGFRTSRLPLWLRLPYAVAAAVGRLTAEDLQAGSPYLTELRLRWVDAFRGTSPPTVVVQVLGDRDTLVSRADSLDVEYMAQAMRIDVPGADHASLVDVDEHPDRYPLLRRAVLGPLDDVVRLREVPPSSHPVAVVLHGIRTSRYATWVADLAAQLTAAPDAAGRRLVVQTPTYGWFSGLDFALPFSRSRNLRTFLEWYGRLHLEYAGGDRYFAGHSNGTYLLGRALEAVPAMYFHRVYLAGSVLPRDYPWAQVIRRGQVRQSVLNDRATCDQPVGWLGAALRGLGMRDVGTAGVHGFDDHAVQLLQHRCAYPGGHGAALEPVTLPHVADYLLTGDPGKDPGARSPYWFEFVGRLAGVLSAPVAVAGTVTLVRWPARRGGRLRLAVTSAAATLAWAIGRSA